jgi:phytanoyl-CoA hydroxylase
MNDYPLSEEQVDYYQTNGFVALPDVLDEIELQDLRVATDEILATQHSGEIERSSGNPEYEQIFVQKVNLWRINEAIGRHVLNTRIAEIARRLARVDAVRLWHDHLLTKMPGDGSKQTPWHQDRPYWPMDGLGQLSCWMALDDVDESNGCMWFVPRSQTVGLLEPINLVSPQDIFGLVPEEDGFKATPVSVPLFAGNCTFHNGLTFHHAGPNTTDRPRRAMVTIYTPDGTGFNGNNHVVTDPLGLHEGDKLDGELFPVLATK